MTEEARVAQTITAKITKIDAKANDLLSSPLPYLQMQAISEECAASETSIRQ